MVIRTANKQEIIEVTRIKLSGSKDSGWSIFGYEADGKGHILGNYTTEQAAMKVMDAIMDANQGYTFTEQQPQVSYVPGWCR